MRTERFVKRSPMPVEAATLYAWHARPGAFGRLTPPWERVEMLEAGRGIEDGSRVVLRVGVAPGVGLRWVAEHEGHVPGVQFRDRQVKGPFARWVHTHGFEDAGDGTSTLVDDVTWALPLGPLGRLVGARATRKKLARMFAWRHRTTHDDLAQHATDPTPRRVLVTGASGLLGRSLVPYLTTGGHEVVALPRGAARADGPSWDPGAGRIDLEPAGALDAVVHLAGENVARRRWTRRQRARIRDSRVVGTRLLAEALARMSPRPEVLVSASGTGFYGDRGDEMLDETAAAGEGFLAETARRWEAALEPAREAGIRVVALRLGMVLTPEDGALRRLLGPFRLGLGGRLGPGDQHVAWIARDDALGALHHALATPGLDGPVNAVAPEAVTGRALARTLGRVLRRPAWLPVPRWLLRLLAGRMADELLLASTRAVPRRLEASGYRWRHPTLEGALRHVLGRTVEAGGTTQET